MKVGWTVCLQLMSFDKYVIYPKVIVTREGKFETPSGENIPASSERSDYMSSSDESSSDSRESEQDTTERKRLLTIKLAAKIKQRAEARERGAIPAFKKRDYDYVKCGMVKVAC